MGVMTREEFDSFAGLIYRKTGIRFEPKKMYFLEKRIGKRMKALECETISEYIRVLRFRDRNGRELQNLTDILTVNETYFFRDFPQLRAFGEHCLEEVATRKVRAGDYTLRIWSAACSTGEEPYTLAVILKEMLENYRLWNIRIIASDIDRNVLAKAERGAYNARSIRDVPEEYLEKHFIERKNGYHINAGIKSMVQFEHLNLSDRSAIRLNHGFDFIFCRNLLIYFDDKSRKNLVDHFYVALNSGGFIFLGSSESIGRMNTAFRMKRAGDYLVYYKN